MPATGQTGSETRGCTFNGLVSLGASTLGSLISAVLFVGWLLIVRFSPDSVNFGNVIAGLFMTAVVGAVIGIPVGMIFGVPLLTLFGPIIPRRRIAMSVLLGFIGMAGGWLISWALDESPFELALLYGPVIGAFHGILYPGDDGLPLGGVCAHSS